MIVLPAGSFQMGAPPDEVEQFEQARSRAIAKGLLWEQLERERPQHSVDIGQAFAVGVFEVTFREWDACVSDGGCGGYSPGDKDWGRDKRPVILVNWEDAQAYVAWLSKKTGQSYRLPSEAEWEYVARAGTTTSFHTGQTILTSQANYNGAAQPADPYGGGRAGTKRGQTVPVGAFDANPFGLHDVHGNVFEWVEDCWNENYAGAPSNGATWEQGDCSHRVVRGGSHADIALHTRSAMRAGFPAVDRWTFIGFRVARWVEPAARVEAEPNVSPEGQLTEAAFKGDLKEVERLLQSGVDPDAVPEDGIPALLGAAIRGHFQIVALLAERDANINSDFIPKEHKEDILERGWWGITPVIAATQTGRTEVVNFLVEANADLDVVSYLGTALMQASALGHVEIAEILVNAGADWKLSWNGVTALMFAVKEGHIDIVRLLVEKGAYQSSTLGGLAVRAMAVEHPAILALLDATRSDDARSTPALGEP